jgi:hypothetical protein
MLGFLYESSGNVSPTGEPFDGLKGTESNLDDAGRQVQVFKIDPQVHTYLMPRGDPGEGVGGRERSGSATAASPGRIRSLGLGATGRFAAGAPQLDALEPIAAARANARSRRPERSNILTVSA